MPEELSRPAASIPAPTGIDDLGCSCEDKVSHEHPEADLGPAFCTERNTCLLETNLSVTSVRSVMTTVKTKIILVFISGPAIGWVYSNT